MAPIYSFRLWNIALRTSPPCKALDVLMKIFFSIIIIVILGGVVYAAYFFLNGKPLPPAGEIKSFYIVYSDGDDIGKLNFEVEDTIKISQLRNVIGDLLVSKLPISTQEMPNGSHEQWMINVFFKNGDQRYIPVFKGEPNNKIYEYLKENYITSSSAIGDLQLPL